ncbi:uncharacterized protein CC84DRAFT_1165253 [Paraphaeosphaeria sporulosa]|uniref:NACHT domain-containing protein n=1 Tax=Paraphaeosphaeria sporulosa TaxID=1460663 RepID=A0A177CDT8_9PLEO|nr:uncharacterized protein CC84DRAFT_1165253 [Paraphaeosphaeria sporulosa]OAG04890.1 hypothetical protein CC84DRAFT_1165253 [Paraphaeosphaeria sporulosa]
MASTFSFGDANAGFQAGIINGPVNNAFHLLPERPETPPPPSIVIPFARDADFVERGTTLDQLQRICAVKDARAALVGLGGVGKSQLAIEHAYRTHERSPEMWVFWVHASNAARFEQSFRDIADWVKIAGRQDPQANIFKLVHNWLYNCKQRWLLVLDNVDDARFLLSGQANRDGQHQTTNAQVVRKPLREYLPHCNRGSILITTRDKGAALQLVEQRDVIVVEPMNEAQAVALLQKKLDAQGDSGDVAELAAVLEYMPLAIVQAAAYIWRRAPRCSVAEYLEEFRRSDGGKRSLLNHEAGHLRRDRDAKNSIIVTWQISFEHLRHQKASAAELLSLMSFFDRQGIPETLLHGGRGMEGPNTASNATKRSTRKRVKAFFSRTKSQHEVQQEHRNNADDRERFENDIGALRDLCLISISADGVTFEMHSLVQLATQTWLIANGTLEQWKQHFISVLCAEFPTGQYENWAACQTLFAHAKAALEQRPHDDAFLGDWATILYRAAWYAESTGSIADAVSLATESLKAREKMLGHKHEDTIQSIAMVADAYSLGGRWNEAEKMRKQVMETRKKKLGADHPDTLTSMANLASTETSKKKLGADHPDTLTSMANLASTYRNQGPTR